MSTQRGADLRTPSSADRVAVAARDQRSRWCTIAVERIGSGTGVLRYEGSESTAAELTPDVVERLLGALSVSGRTAIPTRCLAGGACTLLTIGQPDGAQLYFHAATAFGAMLDCDAADRLRTAVEQLREGALRR